MKIYRMTDPGKFYSSGSSFRILSRSKCLFGSITTSFRRPRQAGCSPPATLDTCTVAESNDICVKVLDRRWIKLVAGIFEVLLRLDQVSECGVNHVTRRRIVVGTVGDNAFGLIDQSLTLV